MKIISDAVYGLLAGFVITLGATAYLLLESTLAGALMFTLGLFAICTFGWNLFTGKVCYSAGKGPKYIGFLAVVWLSNFARRWRAVTRRNCWKCTASLWRWVPWRT